VLRLDRRRRRGGELRPPCRRGGAGKRPGGRRGEPRRHRARELVAGVARARRVRAAVGNEPLRLEARCECAGDERHHSVLTFCESWLVDIGCVGGPDGPTPVGCTCWLKNCMNVSPSTTFSVADEPSLIFSAVTVTVPSCSKRIELLPFPF